MFCGNRVSDRASCVKPKVLSTPLLKPRKLFLITGALLSIIIIIALSQLGGNSRRTVSPLVGGIWFEDYDIRDSRMIGFVPFGIAFNSDGTFAAGRRQISLSHPQRFTASDFGLISGFPNGGTWVATEHGEIEFNCAQSAESNTKWSGVYKILETGRLYLELYRGDGASISIELSNWVIR